MTQTRIPKAQLDSTIVAIASTSQSYALIGPSSGSGAPAFRALVTGDIPTLNQNTTGNAATVTTNANLTGPITSSGNATSVASQTGTGSTFVMNTSPTLVTPILGVATATSVSSNNNYLTNHAVTVSSNAGTCSASYRLNTFTNSSAGTMSITLSTSGAVDGQMMIVRIYDYSAVVQTINWTGTTNSSVSVPSTSKGSTTQPTTVGFMYNSATSSWLCVAVS